MNYPKYSSILEWCAMSGMKRTATFAAIKEGHLRAIRVPGTKATLVDVAAGLAWLDSQPAITRAAA